ncbi:hypothetical protein ABPG72_007726 [Tetrahymena utriculariae]
MGKQIISNQEELRERVYKFYKENKSKGKAHTFHHFSSELVPKTTIYRIIRRSESGKSAKRKQGSGRVAKKIDKKNFKKLLKLFNHSDTISLRQAGRKFDCHHSNISKTLKKHTSIRLRKKQKIPKRSETQQDMAKVKCGRLYRKFKDKKWILDDESYFTLSHGTIGGNNTFYSNNVNETPPSIKYSQKSKYEQKILCWICFSPSGISQPYFRESGLAINQEIYLTECIKKKLVPFIKKYHSEEDYIFWPDLASSHYAKTVIDFLQQKQICFVDKKDNPANVPECRPIEDFWSMLKGLVYKNNYQANSLEQLVERIKLCIKKLDKNVVQELSNSVKKRLDKVRREGVIEKN